MLLKEEIGLDVLPFGLLELDDDGTVLYYRPDEREHADMPASVLVGRNLFTEVTPIAQAGDSRDRLVSFRRGHTPGNSFHFGEKTLFQCGRF
jgi:hypothetical protein